jgi:hypothetical protein
MQKPTCPTVTRFALVSLVGSIGLALLMGALRSSLITHVGQDWERENTATVLQHQAERVGLDRLFTAALGAWSPSEWDDASTAPGETWTFLPHADASVGPIAAAVVGKSGNIRQSCRVYWTGTAERSPKGASHASS